MVEQETVLRRDGAGGWAAVGSGDIGRSQRPRKRRVAGTLRGKAGVEVRRGVGELSPYVEIDALPSGHSTACVRDVRSAECGIEIAAEHEAGCRAFFGIVDRLARVLTPERRVGPDRRVRSRSRSYGGDASFGNKDSDPNPCMLIW